MTYLRSGTFPSFMCPLLFSPLRTHMRQAGKVITQIQQLPKSLPCADTYTSTWPWLFSPVQIKQTLLGCYQEGVLSSLPIKVAPDSAESLELESQATMGVLIPLLALAAVCTGKYHSFFNSLQTQKGFHLGEMGLKPIQY